MEDGRRVEVLVGRQRGGREADRRRPQVKKRASTAAQLGQRVVAKYYCRQTNNSLLVSRS